MALISMTAALILNANLAVAGMALSGIAMGAAALGQLTPVAAAVTQEGIDVLVILNALRALFSGKRSAPRGLAISSEALREDHHTLEKGSIACAKLQTPWTVTEANGIVQKGVVEHEREDEAAIYPRLSAQLPDPSGLAAMSGAHREIQHLARLLQRLSFGLRAEDADRYLIRDAQRVIESIEAIVRLHSAPEEDIYEYAMPA